jgi:hypothetical protein
MMLAVEANNQVFLEYSKAAYPHLEADHGGLSHNSHWHQHQCQKRPSI